MNKKLVMVLLSLAAGMVSLTACNKIKTENVSTQATKAAENTNLETVSKETIVPTLRSDLSITGYSTVNILVPKDDQKAYIIAYSEEQTGEGAHLFELTKKEGSYGEPHEISLPEDLILDTMGAISPDGKHIYLTVTNKDETDRKVIVADLNKDASIDNVKEIEALSKKKGVYMTAVAEDKNLLFCAGGATETLDVYYATLKDGEYSTERLGDAVNSQYMPSYGGALSPDESFLVTALPSIYSVEGKFNLYISYKKGGKWQSRLRLNDVLHQDELHQIFPSISGDGKTLYYIGQEEEGGQTQVYCLDLKSFLKQLKTEEDQVYVTDDYDTGSFELKTREKKGMENKQGVYYEIFVRAFADSDGDGVGDLKGITQKLDYLKDLGIDGLWLMPINSSNSYHGYDVTDYTKINSEYGTEADFKTLLEEAHKRGMKVIMDFVINHTSSEHPWFQEAVKDNRSPYFNYYRFVSETDPKDYEENALSAWDSEVWHPYKNLAYYGIFAENMPDLNYNNPKVRVEIKEAAQKWLKLGVDGFRLDAAIHIYGAHEFEQQEDNEASNIQWWNEFASSCETINPDVYLVGEAWKDDEPLEAYVQPFDTKFNFSEAQDLISGLSDETATASNGVPLAEYLESLWKSYEKIDTNYIDGVFATNHDQDRVMSTLRNTDKAKLAANVYLTLPGNPFIYYGEELGMYGAKPDEYIREPFKWTQTKEAPNTDWLKIRWDETSSMNKDLDSLVEQQQDSNSMYHHYKALIALRKKYPALNQGDFSALDLSDDQLMAYMRTSDSEKLYIFHNFSKDEIDVDWDKVKEVQQPSSTFQGGTMIYNSNEKNCVENGQIHLEPYSSLIIKA